MNEPRLQESVSRCDRPPKGWWCSLERGHEGPCPTRPSCVFAAGCVFGDDCMHKGCAERRAIADRYTAAVMKELRGNGGTIRGGSEPCLDSRRKGA